MGVEILDNGTRVLTAPGATFGTDALLLARFAQPRRNERALDLCSGCGIVSLVWHDAGHRGPCTALEIDPAASALCAAALAENTDAAHIAPVCGDLRQLCTAGPEQGQYDFAACNPPYFTAGPRSPDPRRAEARHTGSCTTADAVDCARRALRDGGRFLLCQRPDGTVGNPLHTLCQISISGRTGHNGISVLGCHLVHTFFHQFFSFFFCNIAPVHPIFMDHLKTLV